MSQYQSPRVTHRSWPYTKWVAARPSRDGRYRLLHRNYKTWTGEVQSGYHYQKHHQNQAVLTLAVIALEILTHSVGREVWQRKRRESLMGRE